jgi:hypothetical protein
MTRTARDERSELAMGAAIESVKLDASTAKKIERNCILTDGT